MITVYIDPIGEAIRNAIWTNLNASLGLKTAEQGDYLLVPAPDDLDTILPLVFVEFAGSDASRDRGAEFASHVQTWVIHYVDRIGDTEEQGRVVLPALARLAELFTSPPFAEIPGYTRPAGLTFRDVSVTGTAKLDDLAELETPLAHGTVTLQVIADSFNI